MKHNARTAQMPKTILLGLAVTPYAVLHITQPDTRYTGSDLPDLAMRMAQPYQQVIAHWHCTEEGRLEARWFPTVPASE
jgi:hypothetical protein